MTGTPFPWDEMTGRWRTLYDEQAKLGQMWVESQAQLARTLSGVTDTGADLSGTATALAELWRSGMSLGSITHALPGQEPSGVAGTTLSRMLDPVSMSLMGGNQVGEALRRMTEGPQLADVGTVERRMARVMECYVDVQTATRSYEAIVARSWMEANNSFTTAMAKRFTGLEPVPPKEALKTWLGIADEVLTRTHRSSEYLEAQRRLLGAGMEFLLAERKLVEFLVEPAGLPTRSEIDELHQTVHTLKRQVRELTKREASARSTGSRQPRRSTKASASQGKAKQSASQGKAKEEQG